MNRNEIKEKLQEIFRDVLDNEEIVISDDSTTNDIEEWTSLTQMKIITTVEQEFNIKFKLSEFMMWENVGQMLNSIEAKL